MDGNATLQDIHKLQEKRGLKVNCYMLTDLFIHMSKRINVSPDECSKVIIPNFVRTEKNPYVQGDYVPFSDTYSSNCDGLYEFDVHCIAMINGSCFDLLLQAKYPLVNDGVNIYASLSLAMNDDNLNDFEDLLPFLSEINEQCSLTGWTLLHQAICGEKFNFAELLLKSGAQDNILDNNQNSPFDILNEKLYDPSVSLETLSKAKEYQDLKMALITKNRMDQLKIENKAARIIQSFWNKKYKAPAPHAPNSLMIEQRIDPQ